MRAAELAVLETVVDYDDREADGWDAAGRDSDYVADEDDRWWWAGYLAHCITTHSHDTGDET
jgi:hypothetical protein